MKRIREIFVMKKKNILNNVADIYYSYTRLESINVQISLRNFYRKGFLHTFFTVHGCDRATDRILSGQRSTGLPRRE